MVNGAPDETLGLPKTDVTVEKSGSQEVKIFVFRSFKRQLKLVRWTCNFGNL